jgi:leucyl/phenylalanyl-tRNA--protein transferase
MGLFISSSPQLRANPREILLRYANCELPDWLNGHDGTVGWVKYSHRGLQFTDRIHIGKEKRYVFSKKFDIRFNTAFEQVVRSCADLKREGKTWITEDLIRGYCQLHRMGFAWCSEAWQGDKLVGGTFGLQIGAYIGQDSMFHHERNASKACYGQLLLRLQERGFPFLDVNGVSPLLAYFGAEWVPHWKFEMLMRDSLQRSASLTDERTAPSLAAPMLLRLKLEQLTARIGRRLHLSRENFLERSQTLLSPVTPAC